VDSLRQPRADQQYGAVLFDSTGPDDLASGLAAILNATTPLLPVLAAHILTRNERMTSLRLVGALCGFMGGAAMIIAEGLGPMSRFSRWRRVAIGSIYGRRFRTARLECVLKIVSAGFLAG